MSMRSRPTCRRSPILRCNQRAAQARDIIANQPAVTWLSYSVHGNEISPSDAAMLTAYHLLAARGDDRVGPDHARHGCGYRSRYKIPTGAIALFTTFETAEGLMSLAPTAFRLSTTNRGQAVAPTTICLTLTEIGSFARSLKHVVTRTRCVSGFRSRSSMRTKWARTAPTTLRRKPCRTTRTLLKTSATVWSYSAAPMRSWFDRFGIDYFTREVYDAFYPGYGASWPSYFGSVAMTYEQAINKRAWSFRQYDGNVVRYRDTDSQSVRDLAWHGRNRGR